MNSIKAIARLAPKTAGEFKERVDGSPVDGLSAADLAYTLGGLPRGAYLLALVSWAGDQSSLPDLQDEVTDMSNQMVTRAGLMSPVNAEISRKVSRLALNEFLSHNKCTTCKGQEIEGVTYVMDNGAAKVCPVCVGTGVVNPTDSGRISMLDVSMAEWLMWRPMFDRMYAKLQEWEHSAYDHISRKID